MGNINFEKFPVSPRRFDILNIESKEKENSCRGRALGAPSAFWEKARVQGSSVWGNEEKSEECDSGKKIRKKEKFEEERERDESRGSAEGSLEDGGVGGGGDGAGGD
jgi:hypothetical protein